MSFIQIEKKIKSSFFLIFLKHVSCLFFDLKRSIMKLLPKKVLYSSRHVLSLKMCFVFLNYILNFGLDANFMMDYIHVGMSVTPIFQNPP